MRSRDDVVAGHRLQHLAQVDDERIVAWRHVDPIAVRVEDLQPTDAVLHQQGEEPGVVVGIDARFPGRRRRVMDELDERQRAGAENAVEVAGVEAETDGEHLHDLLGDGTEPAEQLQDRRPEARQDFVGQPLVGPVEAQVGRLDVGSARRMLGGHVELLAVVGAVVGELGADALPAAEVARPALVDGGLDIFGQGEELLQLLEVVGPERRRDAMADELEEPHVMADLDEVVGDGTTIGRPAAPPAEVDLGDRRERRRADERGGHRASVRGARRGVSSGAPGAPRTSPTGRSLEKMSGPGGVPTEVGAPTGANPIGATIHHWSTCWR
jgi:hypothetical protein